MPLPKRGPFLQHAHPFGFGVVDGQVQSYGRLVKKLGVEVIRGIIAEEELDVNGLGVPGLECNPNTGADLHAAP